VGTPLSCLLRDRGAAAVTVCHRVSLTEWFEDQDQVGRAVGGGWQGKRRSKGQVWDGSDLMCSIDALPSAKATPYFMRPHPASAAKVQRRRAQAMACLPQLPGPDILLRPEPQQQQQPGQGPQQQRQPAPQSDEARRAAAVLGSCQFESHHLPDITRTADFLIVAVGHPGLVRADWVKPGAVVVDVGINVVPAAPLPGTPPACCEHGDTQHAAAAAAEAAGAGAAGAPASSGSGSGGDAAGGYGSSPRYQTSSSFAGASDPAWLAGGAYHVVGDVEFEGVSRVASAVTPVPGGVGPMTIAALLSNTIKAAKYSAGLQPWWPG
jgi:hypothetical protein